jgi:phenylalanine-4-hydroxylase
MRPLPTVELHGKAGGYVPDRPDWTIPQDWDAYTPAEHRVWQTLYERQIKQVKGRACADFIAGLDRLNIADEIPRFERLNDILHAATGWQIVAVPGLVPDEVFFEHLANRRFPAGQFIRRADQLDYLQEPDVFHDVFGHVPMLMHPVMADFIQAYGQGGLRAQGLGALEPLARLYWYTVEFGLVREGGEVRIFGAGILSSHSETPYALESPVPNRVVFDLERVMRTRYRIDDFQETYFVLPDLERLLHFTQEDFAPLYARIKAQVALAPGDVIAGDDVLHLSVPTF